MKAAQLPVARYLLMLWECGSVSVHAEAPVLVRLRPPLDPRLDKLFQTAGADKKITSR